MNHIEVYLRIAGFAEFGILIASAMTPKALDWRKNLAPLHPFLRKLFWVYGLFIVLVIVAFGAITLMKVPALASGVPISRAFCLFVCVFWSTRLGVQLFVFDARPFLTNWIYRAGYHGLTFVFVYLAIVYGVVAMF